ncbi:uncharacterized protein [Mytilus edulis]|uniref:uncharacterized protein n=1 Tax=Mytilus edulis TaxID=6550 RepID=UPI0039EFDCA3
MENKKTSQSSNENNRRTISEEEENYVRMCLLLTGISPRAVRVLFDSEFHPSCLSASIKKDYNTLKDLNKKRIINQSQWNLLFPRNGDPDSNMFDVTLMITLLINLTKLNHYDTLPVITDTTRAADLGRIKYYRNHISHNTNGKIDCSLFTTSWEDIMQAVGRLGGRNMFEECKELKTKTLEQSTVPWNIRVQISQILEAWRTDNSNFVQTRAARHVFECIKENSCVTITASSGVGKTATLRHVALQMADDGYNVLLVTSPHDIIKFHNPKEKTLFVLDDFCGTYSINQSDLDNLESIIGRIEELISNKMTKIIVACRLQIYQDAKFEFLPIFKTCVCNLLSEDFCLSHIEKRLLAEFYLESKASEVIQYSDLYDCFPLLCKLYNDKPDLSITEFFRNPFSVYKEEIDKLQKNGHGKYCALALCVIFNNRLEEEWFTDEINKEKRKTIKNTCEACKLDRGTSRIILLDEIKHLEHTFMKKDKNVYKTKHDKIFDFLAYYFGQTIIHCLIKNADSLVIRERFVLERRDNTDQFVTIVPPKYHQIFIQRIIDDLAKGKVRHVLLNINFEIPEFRQRFLCHLNTLDTAFQRQLALTCDNFYKDTTLLQCCQYNDIPLIQWCMYHGVDVNQCNSAGGSPLFVSSITGHSEIVNILLKNGADINTCTGKGISSLYIGCQKNHIEVVEMLLENKADINKCMDNGATPVFTACENNHIQIV